MLNFLVAKEEKTVKMVDDSTCEVIGIETVNVMGKDEKVHALEAVWSVPEAWCNLISIWVLNEERCRI